MKKKPHIVFFFTDDQRFDTIRALGNEEIHTPNIDRLVETGTSFTRAHIPGGTSGAVCMPSRAMLHTGRTLFHLAGEGQTIPSDHTMLGETLQSAGYRTFGTGKWHNGPESYARSFTDGAEIFFGGMWDHWNVPACDFDPSGRYERTAPWILNPFYSSTVSRVRADHVHLGKHSTDLFADAAIRFIADADVATPMFLYLSFMAPHDPRSMPREFLDLYEPEAIALPENFCPEHPFDFGVRDIRDERLAPYPRTEAETRRHIAEYYAMVSHLDHHVGRVMRALEDKGIIDETLFVFAGDNGLAIGQHGLMGKQNNYDHSLRVPLVFSGPGIPRGEQRDAFTYLLDIYPTLCDLVGLDVPDSVEGRSLHPCLHDADRSHREDLYFAYTDLVRSVRDERYKLIEYQHEGNRWTQLFDMHADPGECNNLADDPSHGATVKRLRERLCAYRDEWDDVDHPLGRTFWDAYASHSG